MQLARTARILTQGLNGHKKEDIQVFASILFLISLFKDGSMGFYLHSFLTTFHVPGLAWDTKELQTKWKLQSTP